VRLLVWVVIWLVILGVSGWVLWRRLRSLRDHVVALSDQLAEAESLGYAVQLAAEERLRDQQVREAAEGTGEGAQRHTLAVFDDPATLAREREALREGLAQERRARRAAALPGWARPVDSHATPSDRKAVSP
jgi:hypothetical protein